MKKRVVSILVTVVVLASNFSKIEIGAAGNEQTAEVYAVTLDAPEEEVLYIPEGTVRIEDNEFDGYGTRWNAGEGDYATKIVLPSTLEYIGKNAFASSCIEEIVIPGNVKEIGGNAFAHCDKLKKVVFEGDYIEKIGTGLFWYCENLETVVMPNAVGEWNTDFAFMSCYKLKNVTVPQEGMDRLGTGMFYACALEEFDIPDCVTTMNYDVFTCCNDLKVLRAGYNVVNFVDGGYTGALNISKGCFGCGYYDLDNVWHDGPANMVLEAPLDSAIVEYARYYRYFTVKYDYPDFERVEYSCDGKILVKPDYSTNKYGTNKYLIYFDFDIYPKSSDSYVTAERLTYNTFKTAKEDSPIKEYDYIYRTWQPDGVNYCSRQERIAIRMDGEWENGYYPEKNYMPTVEYFKMKCYSQGEDFEYELVDEKYFKVVLTQESFEEKRLQIEILKSGEWDSEDAEWELITPAIDTSVLTPTPTATPTKAVTPTATVTPEPKVITTEVPTVTAVPAAPTSKTVITQKVTPTPSVKAVKPATPSIKSAKQTVVKKHGKKVYKKEVKLSWKKAKNADGYVIYMKTGTGKYKAAKTIANGKTVSYTKKNLKKGRTYYFKVRAYHKVNGQKVYGSYSSVKKVKIK